MGVDPPPGSSPANAASGVVTANIVRVIFLALQQVAGRNYESLLTKARLEHYLTALPPDTWEPAMASADLVRLFQAVYAMLGEDLTRLFHRNSGEAYAAVWQNSAWAKEALGTAAGIPRDKQLEWFVRRMAATAKRGWAEHLISEDATAWYLTATYCAVCAGITGVHRPFCAQAPALWSALSGTMLGHRVRVAEVECVALGAPRCKFAFYK